MGCRFKGQVAVVIGAASTLGEGIAKRLTREGATVALFDRDPDALERKVASFRNVKLKASGYAVDVSAEIAVQSALEGCAAKWVHPRSWSTARARWPTDMPILDYPAAEYDRVYSVNLRGSFLMIKHIPPHMLKGRYGRTVLMASISGREGKPLHVRIHLFQSGRDWVGENLWQSNMRRAA